MIRCSECKQLVPADDFGYGVDGDYHIDAVRTSEDEQEQRLCGPAERVTPNTASVVLPDSEASR